MTESAELRMAVGLIALVLGLGALLRAPGRLRNRLFAALCGALTAWNLGIAIPLALGLAYRRFELLYLLGGCAAPPVILHFALAVALPIGTRRRQLAWLGYGSSALLYLSVAAGLREPRQTWSIVAITMLGTVLVMALALLLGQLRRLERGPARRALSLLLGTGVLAGAAGLSDLVPRAGSGVMRLGPVFVLPFLLVLCALVLRHRFLDLDVFFARAGALAAGAVLATLVLWVAVWPQSLPGLRVFLGCLLVLGVSGPLGRRLVSSTRRLFRDASPAVAPLASAARSLPLATSEEELWAELRRLPERLPGTSRLTLHLQEGGEGPYRPLPGLGDDGPPEYLNPWAPLPTLLAAEGAALSRRFLEDELLAARGPELRERLRGARNALEAMGIDLAVPLLRGERLQGWLGLGGLPEELQTAELAAGLQALGAQALSARERLAAEASARRAQTFAALGEMAAGLAHEVRNPVGAIRGAAQVLGGAVDAERAREMLEVIEEETARLGRVVGEFLDWARPESSRREAVELEAVLRSVQREAEAGGFALRMELSAETEVPEVIGDPDQLHRAFANLVRNAFEAAGPEGTLRVHLSAAGDGMIALSFEDDGPGIPAEEAERVFEPFHTTRAGGTGLGLALVQRVVETHGGRIRLEAPAPGRGARFVLLLPAAGPEEP